MKECSKCTIEKSLDKFPKRKANKDGRINICNICYRKMRRKIYDSKNKKDYYIKNKKELLLKNEKRRILKKCKNEYIKPMNKFKMMNALKSLLKNLNMFDGKDYELVRNIQMKLYCEYTDKYKDWYKIEPEIKYSN